MLETNPKILLIDDEVDITTNLSQFLNRAGFATMVAIDGEQGLQKVTSFTPDLIVLDVLMPRMDGREMLRRLRRDDNWIPVILLTQVGGAADRTMALNEGADDYLNKPFDPQELVARIRAVLRRARPGQPPLSAVRMLTSDQITLDRSARRVRLASRELALTPKAVALLEYLMTHPDELIARERLLDAIWGWNYPVGARVVDTRIAELRKALQDDPIEPQFIETIPGQGYRFIGVVKASS